VPPRRADHTAQVVEHLQAHPYRAPEAVDRVEPCGLRAGGDGAERSGEAEEAPVVAVTVRGPGVAPSATVT
jgi:hypothetical protein